MNNLADDAAVAAAVSSFLGIPIEPIISSLLGCSIYIAIKKNSPQTGCGFSNTKYKNISFLITGVIISYFLSPLVSSFMASYIGGLDSLDKSSVRCASAFLIGYGWRNTLGTFDNIIKKIGS
jgi:hypothetical protein